MGWAYSTRSKLKNFRSTGRIRSILVDADNYAFALSVYIYLNLLHAGIVKQLEDYP